MLLFLFSLIDYSIVSDEVMPTRSSYLAQIHLFFTITHKNIQRNQSQKNTTVNAQSRVLYNDVYSTYVTQRLPRCNVRTSHLYEYTFRTSTWNNLGLILRLTLRLCLCLRFCLSLGLGLQGRPLLSPLPTKSIHSPHARKFAVDLFFLERDFVRLFGRGPEAGNVETVVEVRAEVIHPANGEEDVHPELRS